MPHNSMVRALWGFQRRIQLLSIPCAFTALFHGQHRLRTMLAILTFRLPVHKSISLICSHSSFSPLFSHHNNYKPQLTKPQLPKRNDVRITSARFRTTFTQPASHRSPARLSRYKHSLTQPGCGSANSGPERAASFH
jgi:hypothetical protein